MSLVPMAAARLAKARPGASHCNGCSRSRMAVKLVSVFTARTLNSATKSRLVGGKISHNDQATTKTTRIHFQELLRFMKKSLCLAGGAFGDFRDGALEHLQFCVGRPDGDSFFLHADDNSQDPAAGN